MTPGLYQHCLQAVFNNSFYYFKYKNIYLATFNRSRYHSLVRYAFLYIITYSNLVQLIKPEGSAKVRNYQIMQNRQLSKRNDAVVRGDIKHLRELVPSVVCRGLSLQNRVKAP